MVLNIESEKISFETYPIEQCREQATVRFINDRADFDEQIQKLNDVLTDDKKLADYLYDFYLKHPFINGLTPVYRGLFNRLINSLLKFFSHRNR